jgi:hypothetical protein
MPERRCPPPCFISGLKRISNPRRMMSAFGGKADIAPTGLNELLIEGYSAI